MGELPLECRPIIAYKMNIFFKDCQGYQLQEYPLPGSPAGRTGPCERGRGAPCWVRRQARGHPHQRLVRLEWHLSRLRDHQCSLDSHHGEVRHGWGLHGRPGCGQEARESRGGGAGVHPPCRGHLWGLAPSRPPGDQSPGLQILPSHRQWVRHDGVPPKAEAVRAAGPWQCLHAEILHLQLCPLTSFCRPIVTSLILRWASALFYMYNYF